MTSCSVMNCSTKNTRELSFFRFPKTRRVCRQWLRLCDVSPGDFCLESARICSLHFHDHDYVESGSPRPTRLLKPNAVPTRRVPGLNQRIASALGEKSQKREIRRYRLDSQRRNLIRLNYFPKFEKYVNELLPVRYNRSSQGVSGRMEFQRPRQERLMKRMNAIVKKLSRKVIRLEKCCRYWNEVAKSRGKMLTRLNLQKRRLINELSSFRSFTQKDDE